jgi:4-amino-4-deoxy-L-arabinose transferase-like glycosyltransferase
VGRDRGTLRLLGPALAWLAFAAIALPWYVIVTLRVPGLMSYLLENQLWARYATHVHHRSGPPWYFLGVLAAGSLPWTAAMIAGLRRVARGITHSGAREESRLLYCWVFAPLVFFSFSGSKLPSYLLPCFPAIALFAAAGLDGGRRAIRVAVAATLAALVVGAATLGPRALARSVGLEHAAAPLPPLVWAALALWSCAAAWMLGGRTAHAALFVLAGYVAAFGGSRVTKARSAARGRSRACSLRTVRPASRSSSTSASTRDCRSIFASTCGCSTSSASCSSRPAMRGTRF